MTDLTLYIGNKNYSSWSLRPWLALKAAGIPFTEQLSRFDESNGHAHFIEFSPTKKVPALVIKQDGKEAVTIPESLGNSGNHCRSISREKTLATGSASSRPGPLFGV